MKYKIHRTFATDVIPEGYLSDPHFIKANQKAFAQGIADRLKDQIDIKAHPEPRKYLGFDGHQQIIEFSAECVIMTESQWQHVLSMLNICRVGSTPSIRHLLDQVIDEIENK